MARIGSRNHASNTSSGCYNCQHCAVMKQRCQFVTTAYCEKSCHSTIRSIGSLISRAGSLSVRKLQLFWPLVRAERPFLQQHTDLSSILPFYLQKKCENERHIFVIGQQKKKWQSSDAAGVCVRVSEAFRIDRPCVCSYRQSGASKKQQDR